MLFHNYIIYIQDFEKFWITCLLEIPLVTIVIVLISIIVTIFSITLLSGKLGKTLDLGAKVVGIVSGSIYIGKTLTEGSKDNNNGSNNPNQPSNSGSNDQSSNSYNGSNNSENNNSQNTTDDSKSTNK